MAEKTQTDAAYADPREWKSVSGLCLDVKGGYHAVRRRVEKLREDLISSLVEGGLTEGEAAERVSREFVRNGHEGRKGLYVSSEGEAMLGLKPTLPTAPASWRSATQLFLKGEARESPTRIRQSFEQLRERLIGLGVEQGMSAHEAASLIDATMVGFRRTGSAGDETLYASPDAVQVLKSEGLITPVTHPPRRHR